MPVSPGGVGAVRRARVPRADHRSHEFTAKGPGGGARPAVADRRGGVGPRAGRGLPATGTALQPGAEPAIRFVAIVRSAQQIEVLDAFCPPTAGASTQEPWLQTEIHVTRRKTAPTPEGSPIPRHGRVSIRADTNANLVAVPTPWPTNILHDTKNPLTGNGDEEEAKEAPRISDPAPPGPASTEDAVSVRPRPSASSFFFSYVVLAREDAPFARESAYLFDESKTGNSEHDRRRPVAHRVHGRGWAPTAPY